MVEIRTSSVVVYGITWRDFFPIRGDGRKFEGSIVSELMHMNGMINMAIQL